MIDTPSLVSGDIKAGTPLAAPAPGALTGAPIPAELHDPHPPTSLLAAIRKHDPLWVLRMIQQVFRAQVQLRRCTLGKWVRVRGRVRVMAEGTIVIGDRVRFRAETASCELAAWGDGRLEIGAGTTINYGTSISAAGLVRIGEDCLIGTHVNIMDCTFHNLENRAWSLDAAPIIIGDRVWLGNHSVIMKGVTIGAGAVVSACSLVTRDVPPNSMVVGVPARVVKNL
jgi:acetyltransferase-like isoleucine patch superfamily enzyme